MKGRTREAERGNTGADFATKDGYSSSWLAWAVGGLS